ncbi:hypothetical protein MN608_07859 [Microdochium nivale]|nr:hypothetical protein MN608_07859 [Microdochium nivale]
MIWDCNTLGANARVFRSVERKCSRPTADAFKFPPSARCTALHSCPQTPRKPLLPASSRSHHSPAPWLVFRNFTKTCARVRSTHRLLPTKPWSESRRIPL